MATVLILPFVFKRSQDLDEVAKKIKSNLSMPSNLMQTRFNHHYAFDNGRDQYHSTRLLRGLEKHLDRQDNKILGITHLDLYIPILTYVFGEAHLEGPAAIVSDYRLNPLFYGLPPNPTLIKERLIKESIHELGHTLGLKHCPNPQCVMRTSTYVEEIDLKSDTLCSNCRKMANIF
jgi:archaemetzincin